MQYTTKQKNCLQDFFHQPYHLWMLFFWNTLVFGELKNPDCSCVFDSPHVLISFVDTESEMKIRSCCSWLLTIMLQPTCSCSQGMQLSLMSFPFTKMKSVHALCQEVYKKKNSLLLFHTCQISSNSKNRLLISSFRNYISAKILRFLTVGASSQLSVFF